MDAVGHSRTAARAEHQLHPTHHCCLRGLLHPSSHSLPAIAIDPPPSRYFVFPALPSLVQLPSPSRSPFSLTDLITAFCAVKHPSKPPSPARPPSAGVCFAVAVLAASCTPRSRPLQNSVVLVLCRASPSRDLRFPVRIAASPAVAACLRCLHPRPPFRTPFFAIESIHPSPTTPYYRGSIIILPGAAVRGCFAPAGFVLICLRLGWDSCFSSCCFRPLSLLRVSSAFAQITTTTRAAALNCVFAHNPPIVRTALRCPLWVANRTS